MTVKRKIIPAHEGAIGTVHPVDGALSQSGSDWTLDSFTQRRLHEGAIAFVEQPVEVQEPDVETQRPTIVRPAAKVTTIAPKIQTR